jgi:MFS family permease
MLALIATLTIQALATMSVLTPPVLVALAAPELGIDAHFIGLFTSAIYAAACLAAAMSGTPVRRYGAIRISQGSLIFCGIGLALLAAASIPLALLGAVLLGIGYGPMTPASSHILMRQTPPERRGFVFSVKQTGVPLGGALAGGLAPPLALLFGWRGAVLAVAASCVVLAVLVEPLHPRLDDDADRRARAELGIFEGVRVVLSGSELRRFALASLAYSAMQVCFSAFLVAFLTDRVGLAIIAAGLVMAVAQGAGIIGRIVLGWMGDRVMPARKILSLIGFGMAAGCTAVAGIAASWPIALVALATIGLGVMSFGWNGVFLAEVARLAPAGRAGMATGGALALTFLGVVIGPPIFAAIIDRTGSYRLAYLAIAAATAIAGFSIGRGGSRSRSRSRS